MPKWVPKDGQKYWFLQLGEATNVSFDIGISKDSWDDEIDDDIVGDKYFNTFRTRKEAKAARKKIKRILEG